jgi:hypothetical protein
MISQNIAGETIFHVKEIFCFRFFHEISSKPGKYNKGHFKFFQRFPEIFASEGAPTVSMTPAANFATATAGAVDTCGKLTPVSTILAINATGVNAMKKNLSRKYHGTVPLNPICIRNSKCIINKYNLFYTNFVQYFCTVYITLGCSALNKEEYFLLLL